MTIKDFAETKIIKNLLVTDPLDYLVTLCLYLTIIIINMFRIKKHILSF